MLKNYVKIAWRNLIKDRRFTMLNLLGLSTGLACALMIWLWVSDELGMDKYNANDAQLYQVMQNIPEENDIQTTEHTAGLLADALAAEMPEVQAAATVLPASWFSGKGIIGYGDKKLKAGGQFISKDYFKLFSCTFLQGDKNSVLADNNSIAISDELAMLLFHTTNVVGKTIEWSQNEFNGSYLITSVFQKLPSNASEKFDLLFNFELFKAKRPGMKNWGNSDPSTYVLLKKGTTVAQFNQKIRHFLQTKDKEDTRTLFARKFSDKYLYGQYNNGVQTGGRISYVKLFSVIGIFILAIACINFMNLSTAKASRRMKEVGIQKVVGAARTNLVIQYLGESIILSLLSLVLAIGIIFALLPAFNAVTGKTLELHLSITHIVTILAITVITGIVAGSYPALYLSGFKPAVVLKGTLKTSAGEVWIRKGLVVFQFTLSVVAVAAVLIIYRQVNYIQSRNLGYNRDHVIHFDIPLEMDSLKLVAARSFVDELKAIPGVVNASSYYHNLIGGHGEIGGFQWPGKDPSKDINFANLEVGDNFLETMGIKIKEGRNFSPNANASNEIIFNESAIKSMGLKDPVGKTVKFWDRQRQIVGVAEDFNFESLYQTVKPCFFQIYPIMPNILVRVKAGTERQTIASIRKKYEAFNKGLIFDYQFLDEQYQALYASENRVAALSKYFAGLAILISCLGLFGLAAFTAQRRQKEIGIRKVIGASVSGLVVMLGKDFVKLVALAALIAFPLVWWIMNHWLSGFAYRIHFGLDVFLLAGAAIIIITLLTISYQSLRAALTNPVKSLRGD